MEKNSVDLANLLTMFVVEYSLASDAFQVYSIRAMTANNLRNIGRGHSTDYLPVGIFANRADADKFVFEVGIRLAEEAQAQRDTGDTRNLVRISFIIESVVRSINKIPDSLGDEKKYA